MIGGARPLGTPRVPLLILLLVVAVVSVLGIFRGSRMRGVVEALARQYLKRE